LFAPSQVFTTDLGPSAGPELIALISADDLWGDRFWYGHVFCHPDTRQYVAGIFYSKRFINGCTEELLFQRLYHWTVLNPQVGPVVSQRDGDSFSSKSSFAEAVSDLCAMIASFDKKRRTSGDGCVTTQNEFDRRILDCYEEWGQGNDLSCHHPVPPEFTPVVRKSLLPADLHVANRPTILILPRTQTN
jgi:hypothetical protein